VEATKGITIMDGIPGGSRDHWRELWTERSEPSVWIGLEEQTADEALESLKQLACQVAREYL